MSHDDHDLEFEKSYWHTCVNTFYEDRKQFVYARYMEIPQTIPDIDWALDAQNKRILDIGGGPSSMLLKCHNLVKGKVCDPIDYPYWTKLRYEMHNVDVEVIAGEDIKETGWDEVWIYNCLQHVHNVERIINNAKHAAPVLRMFEWINIPVHPGHPQMLTREFLDNIIGLPGSGTVELNELGCFGTAYYGVFRQ